MVILCLLLYSLLTSLSSMEAPESGTSNVQNTFFSNEKLIYWITFRIHRARWFCASKYQFRLQSFQRSALQKTPFKGDENKINSRRPSVKLYIVRTKISKRKRFWMKERHWLWHWTLSPAGCIHFVRGSVDLKTELRRQHEQLFS